MCNCKTCAVLYAVFADYGKSNSLVTVNIINLVACIVFSLCVIFGKASFFNKLNSVAYSLTLNLLIVEEFFITLAEFISFFDFSFCKRLNALGLFHHNFFFEFCCF